MRTEKEVKELLNTWKQLAKMLSNENDAVSNSVSEYADNIIKILEWVLE